MSEKIALTIPEAVAVCPFGRSLLYEQIRNGNLPARKVGTRTFILRSDLERFLSSMPPVLLAPVGRSSEI